MTVKKTTVCDVTGDEFSGSPPDEVISVESRIADSERRFSCVDMHVSRDFLGEALKFCGPVELSRVAVLFSGTVADDGDYAPGNPIAIKTYRMKGGKSYPYILEYGKCDSADVIMETASSMVNKKYKGRSI